MFQGLKKFVSRVFVSFRIGRVRLTRLLYLDKVNTQFSNLGFHESKTTNVHIVITDTIRHLDVIMHGCDQHNLSHFVCSFEIVFRLFRCFSFVCYSSVPPQANQPNLVSCSAKTNNNKNLPLLAMNRTVNV